MHCNGCGTCCRKGGPILHGEDIVLVAQGHVPLTALVTLRRGEMAYDPVAGRVLPLDEEVVKVAGTGETGAPWHCVLHKAEKPAACSIYQHRPVQCRVLFCEDTRSIEALYDKDRTDRRRIILALRSEDTDTVAYPNKASTLCPDAAEAAYPDAATASAPCPAAAFSASPRTVPPTTKSHVHGMARSASAVCAVSAPARAADAAPAQPAPPTLPEGMLELAQAHEEQCPLPVLQEWCADALHNKEAAARVLEAVRFDLAFRELAVERGHVDAAVLPFILGRPLRSFLQSQGLDIRHAKGDPAAPLTLCRTRAILV